MAAMVAGMGAVTGEIRTPDELSGAMKKLISIGEATMPSAAQQERELEAKLMRMACMQGGGGGINGSNIMMNMMLKTSTAGTTITEIEDKFSDKMAGIEGAMSKLATTVTTALAKDKDSQPRADTKGEGQGTKEKALAIEDSTTRTCDVYAQWLQDELLDIDEKTEVDLAALYFGLSGGKEPAALRGHGRTRRETLRGTCGSMIAALQQEPRGAVKEEICRRAMMGAREYLATRAARRKANADSLFKGGIQEWYRRLQAAEDMCAESDSSELEY